MVTSDKGLGPQFQHTVHISEVELVRSKFYAQVDERELRTRADFFLGVAGESSPSHIFLHLWNSPK